MRALTLIRPWCWAIVHAGKDIENRSWPPPEKVIGSVIAIHSGLKFSDEAVGAIDGIAAPTYEVGQFAPTHERLWPGGRIVGTARIVGWAKDRGNPTWVGVDPDVAFAAIHSPWYGGPFGWILRDAKALAEPVPCRGGQGLWTVPAEVEARVRAQMEKTA